MTGIPKLQVPANGPVQSAATPDVASAIRSFAADLFGQQGRLTRIDSELELIRAALARIEARLTAPARPTAESAPQPRVDGQQTAPVPSVAFTPDKGAAIAAAWRGAVTRAGLDPDAVMAHGNGPTEALAVLPAGKLLDILAASAWNTGRHASGNRPGVERSSLDVVLHGNSKAELSLGLRPVHAFAVAHGYERIGHWPALLAWLAVPVPPGCTRLDALRLRWNQDVRVPA